MLQEIANVVDGMIRQMRDYGVLESTVNQYYRGYCKPIIRYCIERNDGYYSKLLLQEYLSELHKKLQKGIVRERYFRSIRRCINLLISFAETGITDFSVQCDTKKYKPIESNSKLIEAILEETDYKEKFLYRLDCCMRHFFCFVESLGLDVAELSDGVCLEFLHAASKTNQGSMNYIIMSLRLITDYFRKHEVVDIKADFSMFRMKYAPQRLIEPYTKDEISKILKVVDITTELGKRDKAILLLAIDTGLRAIDISKLKLQDIDWKNAEIHIIQSKTEEPLSLPLHASVMNTVADYILETRKNCQRKELFLSSFSPYNPLSGANAMDGIIEKYCRLANIEKKPYRSFHSLRRAFATELSIAEVPLPIVSQMLGHTSIDSDQPYLMYNESQTTMCTTDFELIPVVSGVYSDAYIPPIRSCCSTVTMEHLKIELLKLSIMDFCDIPLKEGVYACR
ncbi:tyrosine-type recombinase/integrase [Clostridium kluyveri]|uniref:tyrosine-type recombinase/integrase n=1 Tax=Clostridium kluyveri TaxID=1534 RepID=UPI0022485AB5|nr:tyrosine-type recombinase/integrase [Clostridium kluyveri]UZQ49574.1 tyrosine-type recombinase/integrase [Clostridium kluyveri]